MNSTRESEELAKLIRRYMSNVRGGYDPDETLESILDSVLLPLHQRVEAAERENQALRNIFPKILTALGVKACSPDCSVEFMQNIPKEVELNVLWARQKLTTLEQERDGLGARLLEDRNGNWMDKWGCCKVCDGEIPHGHAPHCDLFKLEMKLHTLRQALERLLKIHGKPMREEWINDAGFDEAKEADAMARQALSQTEATKSDAMSALKYALGIVQGRRALNRTADYLAAVADIELFLQAATERLEHGGEMHSVAETQTEAGEDVAELRKDKERLDWLESRSNGQGWIARYSLTGRGFRLHNTDQSSHPTARQALDSSMQAKGGSGE